MLAEHCCLNFQSKQPIALYQLVCWDRQYVTFNLTEKMQISSTTGTFSYWHKIKRRTMSVLSNHFPILYLPNKEPSINDMELCLFSPTLFFQFLSFMRTGCFYIFLKFFLFLFVLFFPLFLSGCPQTSYRVEEMQLLITGYDHATHFIQDDMIISIMEAWYTLYILHTMIQKNYYCSIPIHVWYMSA